MSYLGFSNSSYGKIGMSSSSGMSGASGLLTIWPSRLNEIPFNFEGSSPPRSAL